MSRHLQLPNTSGRGAIPDRAHQRAWEHLRERAMSSVSSRAAAAVWLVRRRSRTLRARAHSIDQLIITKLDGLDSSRP
jgi:hypothetical protein